MVILAIEHIVQTPDTCGGKPRINGTRMRVSDVVIAHRAGMNAEAICDQFDLSPAQVYAALSYYYDHQDDIEDELAQNQAIADHYLAEGHATTSAAFIQKVQGPK